MNNICATKNGSTYTMCKHCSTMKFHNDNPNQPFWMCKKYNKILKDNKDNFLTKCQDCIDNK